jgi:NADPH-dependent glutamate synthase beta subunit-like oxidoreductase
MNRSTDLTLPPDLSRKRGTGPVRQRRPLYADRLPPCNNACPAGENVQAWLALARGGDFRAAWETIVRDNPLPSVHGRVCYHACESTCNRDQMDEPVSVHAVERFIGDLAIREAWPLPAPGSASGKRALIVGAGPSGLSAAYHLARAGHAVEVRDAGPTAGGMMQFGIPAYRLPRAVLAAEVERMASLGVTFVLNHRVDDLAAAMSDGGFDAAFVAVGAHLSRRTDIPARDAGRILDAVSFLREVDAGARPRLGRRVAVYGGGNTAMDAARVALRLGHEPLIIYRRDRAHMPAHQFEADEAIEEGVRIHWLRTIRSMEPGGVMVEVMELDGDGRPRGTGRLERIDADAVILALGQDTDTAFLRSMPGVEFTADGTVVVSDQMMTGCSGVFAGGDMVPAERTVTVAVGHGKKAARHIDSWLRGMSYAQPAKAPLADFALLRPWYYADVTPRVEPRTPLSKRRDSFEEVVHTVSAEEAAFEAGRCLSCGNCFECDACFAGCPEDAVIKREAGLRYDIDLARCTGCGICEEQCPCHAIDMVPEPAEAM